MKKKLQNYCSNQLEKTNKKNMSQNSRNKQLLSKNQRKLLNNCSQLLGQNLF